jgi:hypothetical protein
MRNKTREEARDAKRREEEGEWRLKTGEDETCKSNTSYT